MKMTLEELKQSPSYRYTRELVHIFDAAGIEGQAMEIPMGAVLNAPNPDYMPVAAAIKTKLIFCLTIYANSNRMGGLTDAIAGMSQMISTLAEEMDR